MKTDMHRTNATFRLNAIALALFAGTGLAAAAEIDTGNDDLKARWDNTVRYNYGMRMEGQDPRILGSASYDESDSKFAKHDTVMNRLDVLSEVDLNYKGQFGARVSASAWYDGAYRNHGVTSPAGGVTSYFGDTYNDKVSRYLNGVSGEFLDAFAWTNFNLGEVPVNVKLGRHALVWGEGLFIGAHAISYSQAPVDGQKAVGSPGIETKEVFLPLNQISVKAQVTNDLSLAAQYFLEWKETRAPNGGTYLMGADTAPNVDRLNIGGGFAAPNVEAYKPSQRGNWGVMAKLNVDAIGSTLGAYYREFDDYNPENGIQFRSLSGRTPTSFRFVYAQNTKLLGLSLARAIGPVSFGSELSYRQNASLNTTGAYAAIAGSRADVDTGARGDTLHAVANGVFLLPKTAFWDAGSVAGELAYSRLQKVTTNPQLYRGVGEVACTKTTGTGTGAGDVSDGCSTKNFLQMAVNFAPSYLGIFPSWDLTVPISINYGLKGVAPTASGGFQKLLTWSVGANLTYLGKHEFSLRYADISAPSKYNSTTGALAGGGASGGSVGATDRGWLAATYRTSF
ncbi:MAG: hypothetical protein RJA98_3418 [Pseudomonadota bacterium]|jgi:hypothetical protein